MEHVLIKGYYNFYQRNKMFSPESTEKAMGMYQDAKKCLEEHKKGNHLVEY